MSSKESGTLSTDEEFQIIDASHFRSDEQEFGLEFHLNLPCPVCASFQSKFICEKCINSGSFTHSRSPNGPYYSELCNRMRFINDSIKALSETVINRIPKMPGPIEELKALSRSLRCTINYHVEQHNKKRELSAQLRLRLNYCRTSLQQLSRNQLFLTKHFSSITQKKQLLLRSLEKNSRQIERLRTSYFRELLRSHFTIELSVNGDTDRFSGAALYIDKENVFVGPEPRLSSHTALTYCVPAILAAAIFADVWLPPTVMQHLCLSGSFLAGLPQRDNLGRVYSAVLHSVHMLCASRRICVREAVGRLGFPLHPNHSEYNPLAGLYCLAASEAQREFDAPYHHSLDGFFGVVQPPLLNSDELQRLIGCQLQQVEQGKEVNEIEESSLTEGSTSDWSTSSRVLSPVRRTSASPRETSVVVAEQDRWEFIGATPRPGIHQLPQSIESAKKFT
ncbi:unnamed protein product [Dicrocoelium dendriticum]|nr:unnamed protein product [Dicrocoelium dendriticum]